jgi:drug/metabolite transporter (DMT)-like permease
VGQTRGEHPGLAGAGAGQHQHRAVDRLDGGALFGIESLKIVRRPRVDAGEAIVFFYMAIVAIATLPTLPVLWVAPASALDLAMLVALGVVGGIAQVFLTRGYEVAPPAAVMPFVYASLLATALLAWAFWGALPTAAGIAGGAIVIASGLFLFYREARLALVRRP